MNVKYKFLQKDQQIKVVKYGFSFTTLIFGGFVLILRTQYIIGTLYALLDYLFISFFTSQNFAELISGKNVLIFVWICCRILIAQNCNYWWYDYLIKQGYQEIKSPFDSFETKI